MRKAIKHALRSRARFIACIYILVYLFQYSRAIVDVPRVRLIEHAVCQRYYRLLGEGHGSIPESKCKLLPIQVEVTTITGWQLSLDAVPSILTAIFYGAIADKAGRRVALFLVCLGELFAMLWTILVCFLNKWLAVQLVWKSSLCLFIGGGSRMFASLLLTMITDMTDYSDRSKYFFFLGLTDSISELTAPPIEAWALGKALWLPFCISMCLYLLSMILIWMLPETKSSGPAVAPTPKPGNAAMEPLLTPAEEADDAANPQNEVQRQPSLYGNTPWQETRKLLVSPNLSILFFCFFAKRVGFTSEIFFPQYASERFHLNLRDTPWFACAQAFGSTLMLGCVLPLLTSSLRRRGIVTRKIDQGVIYGSLLILTGGFFAAWRTAGPLLFGAAIFFCGLGEGAAPAIQSLASSFVNSEQNSRLFSTTTLLDTLGRFLSGPLMGSLHSMGRNDEQEPIGLPFMVSSCLFGVSLLLSLFIRST